MGNFEVGEIYEGIEYCFDGVGAVEAYQHRNQYHEK